MSYSDNPLRARKTAGRPPRVATSRFFIISNDEKQELRIDRGLRALSLSAMWLSPALRDRR